MDNISGFVLRVAELEDSLRDRAIALIWYLTEISKAEVSIKEVPGLLVKHGLSKAPNASRVMSDVRADKRVHCDMKSGLCKIMLPYIPSLYERYPVATSPINLFHREIVNESDYSGTRDYIVSLIREINASYNSSLFDGCAVLMRRIIESLIIETYVTKGFNAAIVIPGTGEFMMLKGLVGVVQAGSPVKFSRGLGKILEGIKDIGDRAAHHRTYITKKQDVDKIITEFNVALDELIRSSGIK